ncbi:Peroxiredoxin Q, chloroplastic [Quillaja saponaria]|uniref:Uncharacterized protein ycf33 n=1 Tax=Quillaja saponaria TaxID=32244 RepID=A0AAD7M357_QUISA|nr:Peroxiredoxin Q, chloroplastic [Quillaja saponaria]
MRFFFFFITNGDKVLLSPKPAIDSRYCTVFVEVRGRIREMKTINLRSKFYLLRSSNSIKTPLFLNPIKTTSYQNQSKHHPKSLVPSKFSVIPKQNSVSSNHIDNDLVVESTPRCQLKASKKLTVSPNGYSRFVVLGAVSVGFVLLIMGIDDQKALALGPEGPLMEEFWDNVRRYALYALTVSTGAIYTILQPIVELLKNPISAILVLAILGGSFYIVSQVLSVMLGVTDFAYDYGY